jgi:hypothetical protein
MPYSATMVLPCKCGAECHVVLECDDNPTALKTMPVFCCKCLIEIGQVPALAVRTYPTAREALLEWLQEDGLPRLGSTPPGPPLQVHPTRR